MARVIRCGSHQKSNGHDQYLWIKGIGWWNDWHVHTRCTREHLEMAMEEEVESTKFHLPSDFIRSLDFVNAIRRLFTYAEYTFVHGYCRQGFLGR